MVPVEMIRIVIGRSRMSDLRARLWGATPSRRTTGARVVIHAVSAGEMAAARALVSALAVERPDVSVILTTGTRAGLLVADACRSSHPQIEQSTWLPWDRLRSTRRWLKRIAPGAVVVIETEIWPNLHRACRLEGVPILIASGRLYPRDVARYSAAAWFFRDVLASVCSVGVQDAHEGNKLLDSPG